MKQIVTTYAYNHTAKTVTLSDFSVSHPVALERLLLIVDVTTNQILYNFADSTVATATISSNNIITLSAVPGGTADTDKIQVTYDVVIGDPTYEIPLLPSGAATSAKQPALGTAGTASSDVITVQGIASMTALKVDGSAVTQPVSGTITANAGTNMSTASLAVESGGNLATLAGTVTSSVLQGNVKQINGVTPLMGAGNGGTGSLRVNIASDQVAIPASQSGTWTVQPGNTANTTAWLVKGALTNNNAAPTTTNFGVLTTLANAAAPTWTEGNQALLSSDLSGNVRATLGTLIAGEDLTNNVIKVEQRYTPFSVTADTQIKSGAGFVHTVTIAATSATPVAGLLTIYDNTAESGTVLHSEWLTTSTTSHTITLDGSFSTGLYVGYDATLANVRVSGSYR